MCFSHDITCVASGHFITGLWQVIVLARHHYFNEKKKQQKKRRLFCTLRHRLNHREKQKKKQKHNICSAAVHCHSNAGLLKIVGTQHSSLKLPSQRSGEMLAEPFHICLFTKYWQRSCSFLWQTPEDVELPSATMRSCHKRLARWSNCSLIRTVLS